MASPSAKPPKGQRSYQDALDHLNLLIPNRTITTLFDASTKDKATKSDPKPDPNLLAIPEMLDWLRRAGYTPSDLAALRCIHVAGTKGKGSTVAFLTSLLVAAGPERAGRVGTYTSPHLVTPRERIALDGAPLPKDLFAKYFFEVWDRMTAAAEAEGKMSPEEAAGPASKPFYFRYLTIMAFHVFLSEGVRSAVVEVGIGGEYDATNVLPAEAVSAAVVTQLGIDHVAMLGSTVEAISWHKAGVIKKGVPAFTRCLEHEGGVMKVLRDRAEEIGCSALVEVRDEDVDAWGGAKIDGRLKGGEFQRHNQALAVLAAAEHLSSLSGSTAASRRLADVPQWMMEALKTTTLRGRQETVEDGQRGIRWLLDGAHTKESLDETAKWLAAEIRKDSGGTERRLGRRVLIFNAQEREAAQLLRGLLAKLRDEAEAETLGDGSSPSLSPFDAAIFSRNDLTKAVDGQTLDLSVQESCREAYGSLFSGAEAETCSDLPSALQRAEYLASRYRDAEAESKTIVLVAGSLHLVGGIIRLLEPDGMD